MPDELTSAERASYAEQLLKNPVFKEAMRAVEDDLIRDWSDTLPTQTNEREALWSQIQALKKIEETLTGYINEFKLGYSNKVKPGGDLKK